MSETESVIEEKQTTDWFDKIPVWTQDSNTKRFEVMSDDTSGRIPVTRLEHWKDFTTLLEDPFFNRHGTHYVYRGHRRFDWELTPTLGRVSSNGIVSEDLANRQLAAFRKAIRGRIEDRGLLEQDEDERQNDELWSVGQHHGLMTPLLDWTYSPFVGLFFAFAKPDQIGEKDDNTYRAVYILNKTFVEDDDRCPDIRVIEPRKDDHGRLVNQAGLFTFSPFDNTIENKIVNILSDPEFEDEALRDASEDEQADILASYICKVYIKNEDRDGCLRHLRRMNVHHSSLFPDLLGASDYCNVMIAEEEKDRQIAKKSKEADQQTDKATTPKPFVVGHVIDLSKAIYESLGDHPFQSILKSPEEAAQVEQGRINAIIEELLKALAKEKVVDWEERESIHAKMRVTAKFVLRKFSYPASIRDQVASELIESMVSREKEKEK